jgi:hypothetical protein
MRAIVCCPIQYFTAFGIASQSPGYFPKAEYMRAQRKRKTRPAVRSGTKWRRIQAAVDATVAWNAADRGRPRQTRKEKAQNPKATKRTPVI